MAKGSGSKPKVTKERAWENPLIPHARLREIYVCMVQARALGARLRLRGLNGQEAARVSTAISLEPGDLTLEARQSGLTAWLRGAKLGGIVNGKDRADGQIAVRGAEARLWAACGAAAALKTAGTRRIAVVYTGSGELENKVWREVLRLAAAQQLPVVFVVLPQTGVPEISLGAAERACGVPCLGVDAADAVALYRVAQESVGRARAGGDPALMECIRFPGIASGDAVQFLGESLVERGLVTKAWQQRVEQSFVKKLERLKQT